MLASSQDKQRQLDGAAALVKEAQANPDPAAKDDVAYHLARAGVGLAEAKSLAEFAVQHTETDCATQSAPVTETATFSREITLAHDWNTLGYIYERQHDSDHASSYLESAWKLDPLAYYGFHLGRIAEQSGDTKAAIDIYRAALQAPGGDSMKASIRERLTALAGDAGNAPAPAEEALTGAAPNLTGAALFDLTYVSGSGAPTAVFVSGSEPLRQLAPAIAHQESAGFTLPDTGPEHIVRRFEVTCSSQPATPAECRLHALGAHEARALLHP
jgi:tetratricopeptide (TPR) repeat protein